MYSDITGVILAGGKSSRMGTNKSFLKIGNKFIIEIITELMSSIFQKNILSTNTPDEYKFLNLLMVEDIFKYSGPLAGIHSALLKSSTEKNFIISCDLPLMNREMIDYIVNFKTDCKIVIPRAAGYLQPLIGIYHKSLLLEIENILKETSQECPKSSHKSLHKLIERINSEVIDPTSLPFYSDELFFNMNNEADFNEIKKRF